MEITNTILFILMTVESGGNIHAVGDDGKAIGLYQIHAEYFQDASEHLCRNHPEVDLVYPYAAFNAVSSAYLVKAYMARYATEERIGRPVTVEDICRIHNGGPNGYKKSSTDATGRSARK